MSSCSVAMTIEALKCSQALPYFVYFYAMRHLLLPFSWLYGFAVRLRNIAFDIGWLKQHTFPVPVVVVGNLSAGGTGKSPLVLFLTKAWEQTHRPAILSRGYGRATRGFRTVNTGDSASTVGDEPLQYKQYHPDVDVYVCEDRVEGIRRILHTHPVPDLLLLDDAFQHRYVKPTVSILVTEWNRPFYKDRLLPAGDLREPVSGSRRARFIVVSKCPEVMSTEDQDLVLKEMDPSPDQHVFFSYIRYREYLPGLYQGGMSIDELSHAHVLLVCGIGNPAPLEGWLKARALSVVLMRFPDHHAYAVSDALRMKRELGAMAVKSGEKKLIITTRKDAVRLLPAELKYHLADSSVYVLEMDMAFHADGEVRLKEALDACLERR